MHKLGTGDGTIECGGSIQDKIERYFNLLPESWSDIHINHQDIVKFAEYLEKYPSNGNIYKYIDWDKIPFDPEKFYQDLFNTKYRNKRPRTIFVKNNPIYKFYFRDYLTNYDIKRGYLKYIDLTLNDLIEKIKKNKILTDYEKNHYICLKNWQDIEKLIDNQKLDNDATRDFKKFIYKKFSVDLKNSENNMKILL